MCSFTTWPQRQEILATNPARRLERRRTARRGDRSIPRARLEKLFTDDAHALRERVLWRLLYETAARAELSYPRAEYLFKTASAKLDPHGVGWTLHQLRHSALQHLAQAGRPRPNSGQEPPSAPGQPWPLRPARRGNLRPHHRRGRPCPASPDSLTCTPPGRPEGHAGLRTCST
ncbi:hypothetical protein [Nonomuraea guangzhouensis]|uniref:Tyr recombinase domain-containing protein n=1 Tax=Nonomuraea guangzhouensis TaxID=1291555 RepID=A0ABW4G6R8_9ACTN|nr:hypothetical protein [Nonomuraea guangzhouensis]